MNAFERNNAIRTRLAQGLTPIEIAKELGIGAATVYRHKNRSKSRKGNRAAHKTVTSKVTDSELLHLDRLIKQEVGASRSAVLRKLVRAATGFYDPSPDEEVFLRKAERELSGISTNLNQIATALNTSVRRMGHASPTPDQIERVREANDDIQKIRKTVGMMLNNMQMKSEGLRQRLTKADDGEDYDG